MRSLLVLVTGGACGLKVWLGFYEWHIGNRFAALSRFGVAMWAGILAYALALENAGSEAVLTGLYLLSSIVLLAGVVGEIVTWEPKPGDPDLKPEKAE